MAENKLISLSAEKRLALRSAMPVARKFAAVKLQQGHDFEDIVEEFRSIDCAEQKLYNGIKETLENHIRRHGLHNVEAIGFFEEFQKIKKFDKEVYVQFLKRVRKAYVKSKGNHSLEYLVSKFTEYIHKVEAIGKIIYSMIEEGKQPDLDVWTDKVILQDNLFEENKQFLKQTLHHLETLEKNKCPIGVPELKLLLYNRDGCRRDKLYVQVERWIIAIYYKLETPQERQEVYKDICSFVADIVPSVGFISPVIIGFIMANNFISKETYDLLVKIRPVICKLQMASLITSPLYDWYKKVETDTANGILHEDEQQFRTTRMYVMKLMQLYLPDKVKA